MRPLYLLLIYLVATLPLQAQHTLVDSLRSELSEAKTDSASVMLNCTLSRHFSLTDPKEAIKYARAAAELATATNFANGKAKALNLMGVSHLGLGEYHEALNSHFLALKIGEQDQNTPILYASHLNLGSVYFKLKDPGRAVKHYLSAAAFASQMQDEKALAKVYNNIGNVYEEKGEFRKALIYFRRAASLQEELGDKKSLAVSLHNIGTIHLHLNQPEKGLPYLFKSVQINEEIENDMIRMVSLGKIGEIYLAMGQNDEALTYAKQSLDLAEKTASSKKMAEATQLMHTVYAALKDYEQAYKYLALFARHAEIVHAESRTRTQAELTAKYESEQKELENQKLKEDRARQKEEIKQQQVSLVLGGVAILLMLVLLVLIYLNRQRLKAAYGRLQEALHLMQQQQNRILQQKNEIFSQAAVLREQNVQLEKNSDFKNKVFSIISHDLKSPFNSIKGILKLAESRNLTEQEVKHIFSLLSKNMEVALSMLDNILIWAKAQIEESGIDLQPVNLYLLAEENIQLALPLAEKKGIKLLNQIPAGVMALADKERVNFVLRNLLMNALKFSYPDGEVRLQAIEQDEEVIMTVSDDGKGISANNIKKLFTDKRFTTPGTSGERGTGLGLMLCRELMESFDGDIRVESKEGTGSIFSVSMAKAHMPEYAVQ